MTTSGTSRTRPIWTHRSYVWSWLSCNLVGLTVCRVLGHKRPSGDFITFSIWLADVYHHPPESEARDIICERCGNTIGHHR